MESDEQNMEPNEREAKRRKFIRNHIIVTCVAAAVLIRDLFLHRIHKSPSSYSAQHRLTFLNGIINDNDTECRNQLRMNRAAFYNLRDKLRDSGRLNHTRGVTMEEQLAIFLHVLAYNVRNRVSHYLFNRSGETISRHFRRVLNAFLNLYPEYIRGPKANVQHMLEKHRQYFQDCIGAIDGTQIPAMVPAESRPSFRNRKQEISKNVMAVVDFDMMFTYVLVGWEGSAADSRVLRNSLTREDRLKLPDGKYYVVDADYANIPGFLVPYRGVRYHLSDYRSGGRPKNAREVFNYHHASLRNVVERTFGVLKKRFPILKTAPPYAFSTQVDIVLACCVLHNHIRSIDRDDSFLDNIEDTSSDDEDEDYGEELTARILNRTQRERQEWANMRDQMAEAMWMNR